jgi:hypothetical protein
MLSLEFQMVIKAASIAEKIHNPRHMESFSAMIMMIAAFITLWHTKERHFIVYIYILSIFKKYKLD